MSIDDLMPTPEKPEHNRNKGKTFDELMKEIAPKMEVLPKGVLAPSAPPTIAASEEVRKYCEKFFPGKTSLTPSSTIIVGSMIILASKLGELRTGSKDKFPTVGGLYYLGEEGGLICIMIQLPEGTDPMLIAKGLKWGILTEISVALTQKTNWEQFFTLESFNPNDLIDKPVLASHEEALINKYQSIFESQSAEIQEWRERALSAEKRASDESATNHTLSQDNDRLGVKNFVLKIALFFVGFALAAVVAIEIYIRHKN